MKRYFVASTRQLRRIESASSSPIFSHFTESAAGVSTIRAFKAQDRFISKMFHHLDENLIIFYPNKAANRWAALRLELVGNLMIFSAAFFAVLARSSISSGLAGVSISLSLSVSFII